MWSVSFANESIEAEFLELPENLKAKGLRIFKLLETRGNTLGEPYTKQLSDDLFEIRMIASGNIARSVYCYESGRQIIILLTFVKKTQKMPKAMLELAKKRLKEYKNGTC